MWYRHFHLILRPPLSTARGDASSCLLHISPERSRCQTPSDRDKCHPAWFCLQPHVLPVHQRLINIAGSPVIPLCSSVYTQLLLHFTACTAGHFQQDAVVSINPESKLDSVWESVIMGLCLLMDSTSKTVSSDKGIISTGNTLYKHQDKELVTVHFKQIYHCFRNTDGRAMLCLQNKLLKKIHSWIQRLLQWLLNLLY